MVERLVGSVWCPVAPRPVRWSRAAAASIAGVVAATVLTVVATVSFAQDEAAADEAAEDRAALLPTDRQQERILDRARRLVAEGRWSDAATLLDEILAADRDCFVRLEGARDAAAADSWHSVKSEAVRLIQRLPEAGRTAYELQFRARAERMLAEAIATDDAAGIVAVARRWFATPAGRRAMLLAAAESLEAGQPLAAIAWLERLAAADDGHEPTLAVMRAMAFDRAGDATAAEAILDRVRAGGGAVRLAGRDVAVSFPPGRGLEWLRELGGAADRPVAGIEWRQPRGDAARNAVGTASRPLLVPRYRVPLARHPEESRRLGTLRRELADQGMSPFPACTPLAVQGTILARSPLGLLAVDFASGKRVWLQSAPRAGGDEATGHDDLARTFTDATSGGISSDGRFVFVVDSHPDALDPMVVANRPLAATRREPTWQGGNTLSAHDLGAAGRLVWRLPRRQSHDAGGDDGGPPGAIESQAWFTGAPLVAGDRLFVMVEEHADLRLDVLRCVDGSVEWSQPLAELDEEHAIAGRGAASRRLAGTAAALGDGVLVCPLGAGTVIAVDIANRSLLWAYDYARSPRDEDDAGLNGRLPGFPGGLRPAVAEGQGSRPRAGWCDDIPIVAAGRVLLTPRDSDALHCLNLQDGRRLWTLPRGGRLLQVAGVVDGRVIVVARDAVEALEVDTGRQAWQRGFAPGVSPSGRGILTPERLFLPLDAPEVLEIALDDGAVVGRSPARGDAVPGNLVAYRGEVISLGVDAIDVFHQTAALEARVETAAREQPAATWAEPWQAQLALERGAVRAGLERLRTVAFRENPRLPPDTLAAAVTFGLGRDLTAALPFWRDCLPPAGLLPASRTALRAAVDGALATGNVAEAWAAWHALFDRGLGDDAIAFADPGDSRCLVTDPRWLRGRLEQLARLADDPLRAEIDASLATALAAAAAGSDTVGRERILQGLAEVAGATPTGMEARGRLVDALTSGIAAGVEDGEAARPLAARRALLLLDLARSDDARRRSAALAALEGMRHDLDASAVTGSGAAAAAASWPLGRVEVRRPAPGRRGGDDSRSRVVPIDVDQAGATLLPGIAAAWDVQHSRLSFVDRFGRRLGNGVALSPDMPLGGALFDGATIGVGLLGRTAFIRAGGAVTAVELSPRGNRRLWTTADAGTANVGTRPRGMLAGVPRNAAVPLGMRIVEPQAAAAGTTVCGRPVTGGLPVLRGRSLAVLDPATGGVLWERHGVPSATDVMNDDAVVCVGTADGRRSPVLSMIDGRVRHEIDLPERRRRLLACGSRILVIGGLEGSSEAGVVAQVRLDVVDVADRSVTSLGEFAGGSRACPVTGDAMAVVDPAGGLTVMDVADRRVVFRSRLPAMPQAIDLLDVRAWEDRLLICIGHRGDADEEGDRQAIAPLQQMLIAGSVGQPLDFSVWAVDRHSGDLLWQVPATVSRHCLLSGQPTGLPVIVFARQIQRNHAAEHTFLGVLCLDKRTGHAVLETDRIPASPHMLFGCDVSGDPERHTIAVRQHGGTEQQVVLEFTGAPGPPRPPHRTFDRPARPEGLLENWNRWLERTFVPPRGS